jgi:hypothetical protein
MSGQIVVRPDGCRAFGPPAPAFCLITDSDLANDFVIAEGSSYASTLIVGIGPDDDLGDALGATVPDPADVLVICRRSFLSSPDAALIGARRMIVMPCASTPVSTGQIRYFLTVLESADPGTQVARADAFFAAVGATPGLRLVDAKRGSSCEFDALRSEYVWNQQAGYLGAGEQQIAPPGELSVLPMEITDFDASRRLALDGELVLQGPSIVHAGYDQALAGRQAALYEQLSPLARHPVLFSVEAGAITGCGPGAATAEAKQLAAVFDELFAADPRYRVIWELGFGINTDMQVVPANCGLNEPFGGTDGVVHIGLGLTPYTEFALTFLCPATALIGGSGAVVLGRVRPATKLNRIRSASCGCRS